MNEKTKKALSRLVQDHKIQAGIGLAVAMNVWHFKGHEEARQPIYRVEEIIDVLKENERLLISDPDGVLHFAKNGPVRVEVGGAAVARGPSSLMWVSRVAYIGAVVLLAANAIDIQRQLRAPNDT